MNANAHEGERRKQIAGSFKADSEQKLISGWISGVDGERLIRQWSARSADPTGGET